MYRVGVCVLSGKFMIHKIITCNHYINSSNHLLSSSRSISASELIGQCVFLAPSTKSRNFQVWTVNVEIDTIIERMVGVVGF